MSEPAPPLVAATLPAVVTAVGGGLLVAASLPPMGFWPLAFAGLVLLDRAVAGCPPWSRFRRGALFGVALLWPTTWWMHDLTLPGWVFAAPILATILGAALAATPPWCGRWLALPGAWLLFEAVKGRWPFGGVPLSALAVGQVAGPLAPIARVGGSLLVGGFTVVVAVGIAALLRKAWPQAVASAVLTAAYLVVATTVAPDGTGTGDELRVAVVQGGGPQGTQAVDTDPREVFERHLAASETIVGDDLDLVVWPENVIDVEGPLADAPEGQEVSDLARRLDATLIVGVTEGDGDVFHNAAIAYEADGTQVDRHEKERRVPFGEFVPFRSLIEPLAPDALPERDAAIGAGEAVLDTAAGPLGVVISWEVFFPDRARDAIGNGGEVLLNPTNGSSFTGTQVQGQQVASSRLRAIETGRWVVQAAPTGFSAIVSPTGEVLQRTGVSERRVLEGTVERRTGRTWAVALGDWLSLALAALALGAGWGYELRRRRINAAAAPPPASEPPPDPA
jgi:apolipoprotein N-acyltransferase